VVTILDFGFLAMGVVPAERSNIPIREVVGGIEVVSSASSGIALERLVLRPGDRPELLAFRCITGGRVDCWPVWFGVIGADLDAARDAAIWEGDIERLETVLGNNKWSDISPLTEFVFWRCMANSVPGPGPYVLLAPLCCDIRRSSFPLELGEVIGELRGAVVLPPALVAAASAPLFPL
jgi:hypothetical protein